MFNKKVKTSSSSILFNNNNRLKKYLPNYLGLTPFCLMFILFVLWPMLYGVIMSFTSWSINIKQEIDFVGFQNYHTILFKPGFSSERFWISIKNLFFYIVFTIPIGIVMAIIIALVVNSFSGKKYHFFRGIFFMPMVLPLFLSAGLWQWLMASDTGLVAVILSRIGIGSGIIWKNTEGYAIALCVIIDVWRSVGFNMILLTAGMKNIPRSYYEAAEIDGASIFYQIRKITIPLLEPILFFVIVNGFISALQVFDIPWILSSGGNTVSAIGGPNYVMLFPVMDMVANVYMGGKANLGRASAEGVLLMAIIMVITMIQLKLRKEV